MTYLSCMGKRSVRGDRCGGKYGDELSSHSCSRTKHLSDTMKPPIDTVKLSWPVQAVWRTLCARPLDGDVEGRAKSDITPQERELFPPGETENTDAPLHMFGVPKAWVWTSKWYVTVASAFLLLVLNLCTVYQPDCSRSATTDVMYRSTMLRLYVRDSWNMISDRLI